MLDGAPVLTFRCLANSACALQPRESTAYGARLTMVGEALVLGQAPSEGLPGRGQFSINNLISPFSSAFDYLSTERVQLSEAAPRW